MLVGVVLTVLTACISFHVINSSVGRKSKAWRFVLFRSSFRSRFSERQYPVLGSSSGSSRSADHP